MEKDVNEYFKERTKKVYIERCTKIETFEEYLSHRYRDNCYYYSFDALMGLELDDFLVRGYIEINGSKNYHHGWIEFSFENNEYIFDSLLKRIVLKSEWYESLKPNITYRKSKKDILDIFLNETYAIKVNDNFWQFKETVKPTQEKMKYYDFLNFDHNNGHVPTALAFARIQISNFSHDITRFIAYSPPSY